MPTLSKEEARARRAALYEEFRPQTPCENCGTTENLQWDHVDPATKLFDVMSGCAKLYRRSRIAAEIAKCRVLCGHCNSLRSNAKHSDDVVAQVRAATGTHAEIADKFCVSRSFVSRVRAGKRRTKPWRLDVAHAD